MPLARRSCLLACGLACGLAAAGCSSSEPSAGVAPGSYTLVSANSRSVPGVVDSEPDGELIQTLRVFPGSLEVRSDTHGVFTGGYRAELVDATGAVQGFSEFSFNQLRVRLRSTGAELRIVYALSSPDLCSVGYPGGLAVVADTARVEGDTITVRRQVGYCWPVIALRYERR